MDAKISCITYTYERGSDEVIGTPLENNFPAFHWGVEVDAASNKFSPNE